MMESEVFFNDTSSTFSSKLDPENCLNQSYSPSEESRIYFEQQTQPIYFLETEVPQQDFLESGRTSSDTEISDETVGFDF